MTSDMPMHTLVSINLCENRDNAYLLFLFTEIMPVLVELAGQSLCVQRAPVPGADHPAKISAALSLFIRKKWLTFPLKNSEESYFVDV